MTGTTTQLNVHLLPDLVDAESLRGSVCVMIDVLRASTTIITALANGADHIVVCATPEETRVLLSEKQVDLIGGERGGVTIEGFQLGNSPEQYSAAAVKGKRIGFTTTNGTRALLHAAAAERILVGGFVNLSSVCELLADVPRVNIICAGTDREVTREDVLAAGAIVRFLLRDWGADAALNDQALLAADGWMVVEQQLLTGEALRLRVATELQKSHGGSNLLRIGYGDDIALAADLDHFNIVPQFDPKTREIRPASTFTGKLESEDS